MMCGIMDFQSIKNSVMKAKSFKKEQKKVLKKLAKAHNAMVEFRTKVRPNNWDTIEDHADHIDTAIFIVEKARPIKQKHLIGIK